MDIALEKNKVNLEDEFKPKLESHLQNLKEKYGYYFPDLDNVKLTDWKMTKNPFCINEEILSDNLQEEFLEMKCNSTATDDSKAMFLNDFWEKYLHTGYQESSQSIFKFNVIQKLQ